MESETQFRSHKITISRHGSSHEFYTEEQGGEESFHYTGHCLTSAKFDVVIKDEEVTVNGKVYGQLHTGDSVNIGDNGVTVNSLNEVETAQYFQTNSE
jgi:glutamine cyclotransferase